MRAQLIANLRVRPSYFDHFSFSSYMIENQKETPQEKPKKNPNQPP